MLIDLRDTILDLLFPKHCLGCGLEGDWLCPNCQKTIITLNFFYCPLCKRRLAEIGTCLSCGNNSYLDGLYVMADYENSLVKDIIHSLKYDFLTELSVNIRYLVQNYFSIRSNWQTDYLLVPVPLHRRKYLLRGFNQARIIAETISEVLGNKTEDVLARISSGRPQVSLSAENRRHNVQGVYKLKDNLAVNTDRQVVLVDDVYTTGATMQECAKVLKRAGFKSVWGLAIAAG